MQTSAEIFGTGGYELAALDAADPQTPPRTIATTDARQAVPEGIGALLDPKHSAIFWIGAAAILGLVIVTGQFRVEAALGGRAGRSK